MRTIKEYHLDVGANAIRMPRGAKIRKVAGHEGRICLWARVDTDALDELRHFNVYSTGENLPESADPAPRFNGREPDSEEHVEEYIGMALCQLPSRVRDVWHVFERRT